MDCNPHPEPWMPGINKHSENGPGGVLELRSITARDLTRDLAAERPTKPISVAWHWRRPHDVRRCCGASLWSGYALPTRRPTAAIDGVGGQGNHLSEPKRCSDKPGHLTQCFHSRSMKRDVPLVMQGTSCSRGNYSSLKTSSNAPPHPYHQSREAGSCMGRRADPSTIHATGPLLRDPSRSATRGERPVPPLQQCGAIEKVRRGSVHAAMAALMRDTVPLPTPIAFATFLIPSPAANRARTTPSTFAPVPCSRRGASAASLIS
jgi:hypothetical protein